MLYEIRFSHYSVCTLSSAVWYHAHCKRLVLNTAAYPPHRTQPYSNRSLVIYTHTHTHMVRRTSCHDKNERSIKTKNSHI